MAFYLILGGLIGAAYAWNIRSRSVEDRPNRAAETVVPKQEAREIGMIRPVRRRPLMLEPRGLVSSALYQGSFFYNPISDLGEQDAEQRIKVLNISNKFHYG